jgi:hypothetical protein
MTELVAIVILLVVIGLLLYFINKFVPMEPTIKQLLNFVVIAAIVLWLLVKFLLPLLKGL